ncbi:hexokinase i [Cryptosporidium bovis]|uniref:hexokinase i n=1 Tax=Cryptosporidium bovis TaxID=310047 RepID=UPI00351A2F27|nr:hexokinase i [Cryptosporidium bovis]
MEDIDERSILEHYRKHFFLSEIKLKELVNDFSKSLELGLNERVCKKNKFKNKNVNDFFNRKYQLFPLKMLDSCINKLPRGDETGVYYSIDMGGTNLRCIRIELKKDGKNYIKHKKTRLTDLKVKHLNDKDVKSVVEDTVTSEEMFDEIATFFGQFLIECGDMKDNKNNNSPSFAENKQFSNENIFELTFTFSFPIEQVEVGKANLITWTKGIETGRGTPFPVEGCDVGELLNSAFSRRNIPAHCKCIINDTTGTLISAIYDSNYASFKNAGGDKSTVLAHKNNEFNSPYILSCENGSKRSKINIKCNNPCIGVVIGTGLNSCYIEPNSKQYGYKGLIINTECGDFYSSNLPITDCDLILDWNSDNRGEQLFEKMISGNYLGEISRLLFINSLKDITPKTFFKNNSVSTEDISNIVCLFEKSQNEDFSELVTYLKNTFLCEFNPVLAKIIAELSLFVLNRAAQLVSVMISALFKRIENYYPSGISVAIDGSIWTKNSIFRKIVKETLCIILGGNANEIIQVFVSDDGSGKGAAILAAVIPKKPI